MKKLIPTLAIGWASVAWAAPPAALTTIEAIHALANAQASQTIPVAFEATVTYFRAYEKTMFVQDGDMAIYVEATTPVKLVPGDRILIRGTTQPSFRPFVLSNDIALLRHGSLPEPAPATFEELIRGDFDCRLVSVRAVVHTSDVALSSGVPTSELQMQMENGSIDATVDSENPDTLKSLLDADVEVTGVASGTFDGKMQQTGALLHVTSSAGVKVLKRAVAEPWSLPVAPMDLILAGYRSQNLSQRIRVHGVITYYQPGSAVVLQDGSRSLWIETRTRNPLRIGEVADATGFPDLHDGFLTLTESEIQDRQVRGAAAPEPVTWKQASSSRHIFDLVSIEGVVLAANRMASQDEYVLVSDGYEFSAIYRHPDVAGTLPIPQMRPIRLGSRVRVNGICVLESSNPFGRDVPFSILLRSFDDITVVAKPSLLSTQNLTVLVGLLLAVVIAVGARGWIVESRMRRQNAALGYFVQRRGRILEDINGLRPLAEIIEQITELVSFRLQGAPCWCQIADGARLGNCPEKLNSLRVVCQEIPARSGPALGTIYAALHPLTKPGVNESEALSMAAGIASLAIETRRLYTDLRHRSEFDLLTDIHNRFSLDKHLDALIEEARLRAGIFGVIYIDLDRFKPINDQHGHHIGDLILQEAVLRMKRQLRSQDLLARMGGDEFAALVPVVHSRADVAEIALRVERCLDEPFVVEEITLHGSASVGIAVYPEDGTSKDSLLRAADAAMYEAKNAKKQIGQMLDGLQKP